MSIRTRQISVALVLAIGILWLSSDASGGGEKEKKLLPAVGKIALKDGKGEVKGKLADSDPKDVMQTQCYCKVYTVKFEEGKKYQIDCTSDWDNWLRLEDAKGKQLAFNDDTNNTDAQIIFECKKAGEYRVIVTSFAPDTTGDFTVTVAKQ